MAAPTLTTPPTLAPHPVTPRPGTVTAGILGLGAALPRRVVTNDDLAATLDTSDEWIRSRTGIGTRHVAAPHETTSTLAIDAARRALDDARVGPDELDAVLVATTTPEHRMPATAPWVAAALGTHAAATDLHAACSGFVNGLQLAGGLIATGASRVLLVGAEVLTRVVDQSDRTTAVLFGDGAGAVVLGAGTGELGPFDVGSDGSLRELLWIPPDDGYVRMRGREVYRHAVTRMTASARAVLDRADLAVGDLDLFVGHQANARILDAVISRLGLRPEQTHVTVDRHGNTSAASIPLALADAAVTGRLRPGSRVLLTAFGAGLTWASCLLTWPEEAP
ncbi:MAG TPA: beta-ketoacyl-ACP synthase III [Nitriliruptorales bacterium]